jgi:hypothetical protein
MLNNKTTYSFLLFFSILIYNVSGQQVYIESGVESAYFKDYVNDKGENTLDLNYSKSYEFFLESGVRINIYKNRLKWGLGLSYNKFKINTGFYSQNESIPLTYNLAHVGIKTGVNFAIVNEPKFKVQVHAHLSHDWLISGTSTYRNVVNDLYKEGTFDRTFIRFHKGVSVEYTVTDNIATYINYNVADSFREKNKDSNIEEIYTFHSDAISFGILFNIINYRPKCYGGF